MELQAKINGSFGILFFTILGFIVSLNSWVFKICLTNLLSITFISIFLIIYKPSALTYSKYEGLRYLLYVNILSISLSYFFIFEIENKDISERKEILEIELQITTWIIVAILGIHSIFIHFYLSQLSQKKSIYTFVSPDGFLLKELEFILKTNSILMTILLHLNLTTYNPLFSFISSLPIFLYPAPAIENFYIFSIFDENSDLYWKTIFASQSYYTFRSIIILPILSPMCWSLHSFLSYFYSKRTAWNIIFLYFNFQENYDYSLSTFLYEFLFYLILHAAIWSVLNKYEFLQYNLIPFSLITALFCSTWPLRVFGLSISIRLIYLANVIT
ncbi:unnamed protein product [Blepharisma stoltei]|uniref:Uncharacterized protein n=1 Tax=Blepharisma stoltei TaxID=1481888 RepID=A0AAU9K0X6_9CILI|nr:unnamed protein product [Blepharisma stoltei]